MVHHKGPVLDNRFTNRLPSDQQEAHLFRRHICLGCNKVAALLGKYIGMLLLNSHVRNRSSSIVHICKPIPFSRNRLIPRLRTCWHSHIEEQPRITQLERPFNTLAYTCHDSSVSTTFKLHYWDVRCLYILIPWLDHLVFRWEIDPQLEAMQVSLGDYWHFRMHNPATRSHPLNTSITNYSLISHAVTMFHLPTLHNGTGFKPSVRVVWKPSRSFFSRKS
mmetsp:Transcript_165/g.357  ORF Transcript_165/g.357 Transcript_165/m.357 type:complete len:220 (-) Transcript_165:218-877(-)